MTDAIDVRALRERCGWTQAQMGQYLGLDRSCVSRMENGQPISGPTEKLLRQLIKAADKGGAKVKDCLNSAEKDSQ